MQTRREALVVLSVTALAARAAQPLALTSDELALTANLVDIIIPRTETPGARDAQVHILIDERAASNAKFKTDWKALLAKFSGKDPAAAVEQEYKKKSPYFRLLKDTTIDLYYGTKEGLATELGWHGNTYVADFRGCEGE